MDLRCLLNQRWSRTRRRLVYPWKRLNIPLVRFLRIPFVTFHSLVCWLLLGRYTMIPRRNFPLRLLPPYRGRTSVSPPQALHHPADLLAPVNLPSPQPIPRKHKIRSRSHHHRRVRHRGRVLSLLIFTFPLGVIVRMNRWCISQFPSFEMMLSEFAHIGHL